MLDSETNKDGINALARAHALLILVPQLLEAVKRHVQCPSWAMGAIVWQIEQSLEHGASDEAQLEALYQAMTASKRPAVPVRVPSCEHQTEPWRGPCADCGKAGRAYLTRDLPL